jgi:hypothetical protein
LGCLASSDRCVGTPPPLSATATPRSICGAWQIYSLCVGDNTFGHHHLMYTGSRQAALPSGTLAPSLSATPGERQGLARTSQPLLKAADGSAIRSRDISPRSCVLDGTIFTYYDALARCVLTLLAAAAFAFLGAIIFGNPAPSLLAAMLAVTLICAFLFLSEWDRSTQPVAPSLPLFRSRT